MGKLSGEFREPNRKDKVTRFRSVTYARQLGLLVNTLGSHLKTDRFKFSLAFSSFHVLKQLTYRLEVLNFAACISITFFSISSLVSFFVLFN